jgi:hypothetical protein
MRSGSCVCTIFQFDNATLPNGKDGEPQTQYLQSKLHIAVVQEKHDHPKLPFTWTRFCDMPALEMDPVNDRKADLTGPSLETVD